MTGVQTCALPISLQVKGYGQVGVLLPQGKDWNNDLVAQQSQTTNFTMTMGE